ncbi:MAG: hypothetical protein U0K95_07610 [Eubacterium sp.]|nr:hypothetical protein [Eubacterium sp.]
METVKTTLEKPEDLIEEVARELRTTKANVQSWLDGSIEDVELEQAKRLQSFFGCDYKYLISEDRENNRVSIEEKKALPYEEYKAIKKVYLYILGYIREIENVLLKKYTKNEIYKLTAERKNCKADNITYLYTFKGIRNIFEDEMINMSRRTYEKFNEIISIVSEIEVIKDMYGQNYSVDKVRILIDNNYTDLEDFQLNKELVWLKVKNHKAKVFSQIRELIDSKELKSRL